MTTPHLISMLGAALAIIVHSFAIAIAYKVRRFVPNSKFWNLMIAAWWTTLALRLVMPVLVWVNSPWMESIAVGVLPALNSVGVLLAMVVVLAQLSGKSEMLGKLTGDHERAVSEFRKSSSSRNLAKIRELTFELNRAELGG